MPTSGKLLGRRIPADGEARPDGWQFRDFEGREEAQVCLPPSCASKALSATALPCGGKLPPAGCIGTGAYLASPRWKPWRSTVGGKNFSEV